MDPSMAPNGTVKKQHQQIRHPPASSVYRECLKNHAASLGGHAVDGCGEFMPSPSSDPSDPSSLTCAACACHRNFHRHADDDPADEYNFAGDDEATNEGSDDKLRVSPSPPPPSAPHMLLALSTGLSAGPAAAGGKKRYRSKFSAEQKGRMQELSERLGWRMQRRDDLSIDDACRQIGVGKGVFKVWMHNNKHHHLKKPSPFPPPSAAVAAAPSAAADPFNFNPNPNPTVISTNDAPPPRFVVGFGSNGSASS